METLEYEMTRNLTLLFFLERLLERGEPRTLHDLSCQFGSKGFTKEMRQIAGGSQSGNLHLFLFNKFLISRCSRIKKNYFHEKQLINRYLLHDKFHRKNCKLLNSID